MQLVGAVARSTAGQDLGEVLGGRPLGERRGGGDHALEPAWRRQGGHAQGGGAEGERGRDRTRDRRLSGRLADVELPQAEEDGPREDEPHGC
jgi:hypothetical protein